MVYLFSFLLGCLKFKSFVYFIYSDIDPWGAVFNSVIFSLLIHL